LRPFEAPKRGYFTSADTDTLATVDEVAD
jgi:hypothetical protein